jgi:hypothetical protein
MSNDLQMTYVMLRLNRWAMWVRWQSNGSGESDPRPHRVVSSMGKLMDGVLQRAGGSSMAARNICPVDVAEGAETDRCVHALPSWAYLTVQKDYLMRGTQESKALALGINARAFRYRRSAVLVMMMELINLAGADLPLVLGDSTAYSRRTENISADA